MGILGYNEVTYYYHQRHFLFPSIVLYWRSYQKKILESLKGKEVVLAGDGRHDSMGHSAKYGTYTIFCCTIGLIIHLVVIQVNTHSTHCTNKISPNSMIAFSFLFCFRQTKQEVAQQWRLLVTKKQYSFCLPPA